MTVLAEIAIVVVMVAATFAATACFLYLVVLTVLEQYLLRRQRDRRTAAHAPQGGTPQVNGREARTALRQSHA